MRENYKIWDLWHFSDEIWEVHVPKKFKLTSLAKFDEHNNLFEHVISINIQMTIIEHWLFEMQTSI